MEKEHGRYRFFSHTQCEYFPCHAGADPQRFNCLFCYCPLYALGPDCGGNFTYNEKGRKVCAACLLPHSPEGYDYIVAKYPDLARRMEEFQRSAEPSRTGEA